MFKFESSSFATRCAAVLSCVLFFSFPLYAGPKSPERILNHKLFHLGDNEIVLVPGSSAKPEGERLDLKFEWDKSKAETTLELIYWDINNPTAVEINGQNLGSLPPSEKRKVVYLQVPARTLRKGENTVSVIPRRKDDCVIGKIVLHDEPFREFMDLELVKISVKDSDTGKSLPARVTVVDAQGAATEIFLAPTNGTAVRTGLIYVSGKETEIALRKGDYTFYASRGMEWSRDKQTVSVKTGTKTKIHLQMRREVDTKGFVAADTHVHTLTFSGHGDATMQERMVTLAGEGVELAVATDHNHHTDYRPVQKELGLNSYFTSVIGNEVTTKFGHINAFPMTSKEKIPNHRETDWIKLVEDIRFHGAKVVILNHPRWKPSDVLAGLGLNTLTGEQNKYAQLPFDGIELANSYSEQTETLERFDDWFALLNHGEKIKAVGSSDSHSVGEVVGQGRTYLRSSTDNPAKISIDESCKNFLAGQSSISLGMFADISVETNYHAGDVVPVKGQQVNVRFRVAAPSWVTPQRALLFLNGNVVAEKPIHHKGGALNALLEFTIPAPKHDAHLVCVALGDRVTEPFWTMQEKHTLAANNPVFLDADNNGVYRSPRETAKIILSKTEKNLDAQWNALDPLDDGIAAQLLSLIYKDADANAKNELRERLQKNANARPVFRKFLALSSAP